MRKALIFTIISAATAFGFSQVSALVSEENASSESIKLEAASNIKKLAEDLAQGDKEAFMRLYGDFMRAAANSPKIIEGSGARTGRVLSGKDFARIMQDSRAMENLLAMYSTKTEPRIYFGEETTAFPEVAAIRDQGEKSICSGTLIASNAVLTAKHCHCGGVNTKVYFGSNFRDAVATDYVKVKSSIPYSKCSQKSSDGHDLAILVLERTIQGITPRAFARGEWIDTARSGRIIGFGLSEDKVTKPLGPKRVTDVPIVSTKCEGSTKNAQGTTVADSDWYKCTKGMEIVAKAPLGNKKDTCSGDSGGPILIQAPNKSFYLAGATSRGVEYEGAADCGDGGIYPRMDGAVLKWFEENKIPITLGNAS